MERVSYRLQVTGMKRPWYSVPSDTFYEDSKNLSKIKRETFLLTEIHKEISKSVVWNFRVERINAYADSRTRPRD